MFDISNFRFSQTSLNSYAYCPRQFHLRYITPIHWPAEKNSPQLLIEQLAREGALFHRLAEQYFLGISPELIERQIDPLVDSSVFRNWKNFLFFAQSRFKLGDSNQKFLPENSLFFSLAGYNLEAKVDLLHINLVDNTYEIFDWKTTRIQPVGDTIQTKIYLLALADLANKKNNSNRFPFSITYWFVESPKELIRITKSRDELEIFQNQIIDQISQINFDTNFLPVNDGSKCGRCPFRTFCQTGLHASVLDQDSDFEKELEGWFENTEL